METNENNPETQNQENINSENNQLPENITQENLILGKFKSVDELAKAYKNIQSQSGQQSKEIGELRKKAGMFDEMQKAILESDEKFKIAKEYFSGVVPKYAKDEYFKNPEFTNLFQEAYKIAGANLDTDKLVSLLDEYVNARINLYEKSKSAKSETEEIKAQMNFSQSDPKKNQTTMPNIASLSDKEIDEFVAKYI